MNFVACDISKVREGKLPLNASIQRYRLLNLEAFTHEGNVYLIKKNKVKKI